MEAPLIITCFLLSVYTKTTRCSYKMDLWHRIVSFCTRQKNTLDSNISKCYWWTQYNDVIWPFLMPHLVHKISDSWMNYSNPTLPSHSPCALFRMQPPNNTPQTDVPRARNPRVVWRKFCWASGLLKHWQAICYTFKHGVLFLKHDNRQILTRSSMLSC